DTDHEPRVRGASVFHALVVDGDLEVLPNVAVIGVDVDARLRAAQRELAGAAHRECAVSAHAREPLWITVVLAEGHRVRLAQVPVGRRPRALGTARRIELRDAEGVQGCVAAGSGGCAAGPGPARTPGAGRLAGPPPPAAPPPGPPPA